MTSDELAARLSVVLFRKDVWDGLAAGTITVAFRRWKRPSVKAGGTLRSPGGLLAIDAVDVIDASDITDDDAIAAGHADAAEVIDALGPDDGRAIHRVRFHPAGPDPRDELRADDELTDDDVAELEARLDRLDAHSPDFAWTRPVLDLIATSPGLRAADMATELGCEKVWLKAKVVKLKGLGLTISLSPGYRLSARGEALHRAISGR